MTSRDEPTDAALLVPHTGLSRLIQTIERATPDAIEATGMIPAGHPLVIGRNASPLLAIELGAQAAAAMETLHRRASGADDGARVGSLVRVREARFLRGSLPVDTAMHVTARLEASAPPLAIYRIATTIDGVDVVSAVISTHSGTQGGRA